MRKEAAVVVLAVAVLGCNTRAERNQLREYLSVYEAAHLSSGVVLVARGDSILYNESFGYADAEQQIESSPATRFRVGSITKSMTWAAIERLAEQGQLDLDRSVADIIGTPALPQSVTVRHLLTHQAGVADWGTYDDANEFTGRASSTQELAAWISSKPLTFAPGTDRSYSNSGYIVLARAIEVVSGRSYGEYLAEELFLPLGMEATQSAVEALDLGRDVATGYVPGHQPTPMVPARQVHPSILVGSGSVVATAADLFTWSRSAPSRSFPWDQRTRHNRPVQFMGGFVPGFGAWLERYVTEDLTIIVLTNLNNGAVQKIVVDVGAMILGEPYEAPVMRHDLEVSTDQSQMFVGSWSCGGGLEFTIRSSGMRLDLLWRHRPPSQPVWLQPDGTLFYPQDWALIRARDAGSRQLSYEGLGTMPSECRLAVGR